jgi:hypothetical protein
MVLSVQEQQLTDNRIGHEVIYLAPQEHDPLPEQKPHGIALAASHGGPGGLRRPSQGFESDMGLFTLLGFEGQAERKGFGSGSAEGAGTEGSGGGGFWGL